MAEDKYQPGPPSGISPQHDGDGTLRASPGPLTDPPITPLARYAIYLAVILGLSALWVVVLRIFGYSGLNPALVGVVLGVITFASSRSVLVDRFLKIPATAEVVPQPADNLREIIETVVFVVVLVLLLKSFVAEAFVIPTGSMAETLYGYQKIVKCPTCAYKFPVNCSDEVEKKEPTTRCTCPNCLQKIQFNGTGNPGDSSYVQMPDPGYGSGDRVLVAKFLYDLLGRLPDRLDVVVFKFPGESNLADERNPRPRFPGSGPYQLGTQINYIKRLIGLPGEAIAIQRGKLYVLPANRGLVFNDIPESLSPAQQEARRHELWRYEYMHECCYPSPPQPLNEKDRERYERDRQAYKALWDQHRFEIIRKNPENIVSMKRLVFDQDFPPSDQGKGCPVRWAGTGWTPAGKGFTSSASGGQTSWLHYTHTLRPEIPEDSPEPELITDLMGYNAGTPGSAPPTRGQNWVGDLILETEIEVTKPEGEVVLELSKGIDRFQAHWDLADGNCKLLRIRNDGRNPPKTTELASRPTAVRKAGSYRLRFANVDQRLTVWVDKDLPFGDGVNDDDPYLGGPVMANDLEPASIGVTNAAVTARSLKLFRDTYYTTNAIRNSGADVPISKWGRSGETSWAKALDSNMPILFLYVQKDHFLCLGDNSPNSSDGRTWGLVPARLLLGRALLVYYPFNRLGRID
jgi:signal peptidase I